jgi:uncharacterized MAPEG superfamily protein
MTNSPWMLVAASGLQWALIMLAASPRLLLNGLQWGFGNRETASLKLQGWADRAQRASNNLAENLVLFAVLVLVAHVAGKSGETTELGAMVFLGGRVAHAVVFIAGIPYVRTLSWAVSIVGMGIVASALL